MDVQISITIERHVLPPVTRVGGFLKLKSLLKPYMFGHLRI